MTQSEGEQRVTDRVAHVVERNIAALLDRRTAEERALGWQDRLARAVGSFAGSMVFVWVHVLAYGAWLIVNAGLVPGVAPFDPSFVILAMMASVESIFLSTFILITQNRMQSQADRRADLHLQISLLAEHELTRVMDLVSSIAAHNGLEVARQSEITDLRRDVHPEEVLNSLERQVDGSQGEVT